MPVCALCQKEVSKLCRSHIIPEPFYADVYDEKGRFPVFSNKAVGPVMKPQQIGLREHLLCLNCEGMFSKWETYALGQLFHRTGHEGVDHPDHMEFKVDYSRFKLFQMSILWRMGVTRHEVFSEIALGERHLERLRAMLLDQDPGTAHEYMCQLVFVAVTNEKLKQIILPPKRAKRIRNHINYYMIAGGFLWHFVVSSHSADLNSGLLPLREDGHLRILKEGTVPKHVYMKGILDVYGKNEGYLEARRERSAS